MKQFFLIAIALVVPLFFGLLVASSVYHRRKKRERQEREAGPNK